MSISPLIKTLITTAAITLCVQAQQLAPLEQASPDIKRLIMAHVIDQAPDGLTAGALLRLLIYSSKTMNYQLLNTPTKQWIIKRLAKKRRIFNRANRVHALLDLGVSDIIPSMIIDYLHIHPALVNVMDDIFEARIDELDYRGVTLLLRAHAIPQSPACLSDTAKTKALTAVVAYSAALMAKILLAGGTLPDFTTDSKPHSTPLIRAAYPPNPALVTLLIQAKADVNRQDIFQKTPLHHALQYEANSTNEHLKDSPEKREVIQLLLDAGANPEITDGQHGQTALDKAAETGYRAAVKILIKAKANVNAQDGSSLGPLSEALYAMNPHSLDDERKEVIRCLIHAGAHVELLYYKAAQLGLTDFIGACVKERDRNRASKNN